MGKPQVTSSFVCNAATVCTGWQRDLCCDGDVEANPGPTSTQWLEILRRTLQQPDSEYPTDQQWADLCRAYEFTMQNWSEERFRQKLDSKTPPDNVRELVTIILDSDYFGKTFLQLQPRVLQHCPTLD